MPNLILGWRRNPWIKAALGRRQGGWFVERKALVPLAGLTVVGVCHYICPMDSELAVLENKVEQLLARCETLFAESSSLRSRIADLESDRQRLIDKIDTVALRIEDLMAQIPQ